MLARVITFAVDGVDARRVWVEADIRLGLPAFTVVGLADKAVREARERVRAAMINSGYEFPLKRITVNMAPAYLRKVGPRSTCRSRSRCWSPARSSIPSWSRPAR
jgi:magnesium chelatase family protein